MKNSAYLLCAILLLVSFTTLTAYAKSAATIEIKRNPLTRHFYFSPTKPSCLSGKATITIKNTTESSPVIAISTSNHVVVPPFGSIKETVSNSTQWKLLEPDYLGGNATVKITMC